MVIELGKHDDLMGYIMGFNKVIMSLVFEHQDRVSDILG